MTGTEFENGVNNILDNTPAKGVNGSGGVTKAILKQIVAFFRDLLNDVNVAYEAGITWRGAWSSTTAYAVRDAVTANGNTYRCKLAHTNQAVTNGTFWDLVAAKGVDGALGAVGAMTTSGVLDWNDISNAKSGSGLTLLQGNALNGPGGSPFYHVFNFEFNQKDGTGNLTQLAIPYQLSFGDTNPNKAIHVRIRFGGVWTQWIINQGFQEVVLYPNGSNIVFNLRRPYNFRWFTVQNDGVTINSAPSSSINANTDALITLSGAAGKTITVGIQRVV